MRPIQNIKDHIMKWFESAGWLSLVKPMQNVPLAAAKSVPPCWSFIHQKVAVAARLQTGG